jgi:hypothetical protein
VDTHRQRTVDILQTVDTHTLITVDTLLTVDTQILTTGDTQKNVDTRVYTNNWGHTNDCRQKFDILFPHVSVPGLASAFGTI